MGMRITNTHVYFYGGPFSNWATSPFILPDGNITVHNAEQAFMFCKAVFFKDQDIAYQIILETNPKKAKKLGREIKGYDDKKWEKQRFYEMVYVNIHKYSQNKAFGTALIETKDRVLVEASPYDKIWGVGLDENNDLILDHKNWKGQNLLGKALMEVREKLRLL